MTLTCEECGVTAPPDPEGLAGLLGGGPGDEDEKPAVYLFCPKCAEREYVR